MKAIRIEVFGRVQGVYFRANTCQKAMELGINGRVKNQDNGSVEIIAEGEEDLLEELINCCHKGPVLAKVSSVIITSILPQGFNNFSTIK